MLGFLKKIFGTAQSRTLKRYGKIVKQINQIELSLQQLSEEEVINKTQEFRKRYQQGETLDSLLPEAFAVVKNICRRLVGTEIHVSGYNQKWDMIPYDVQILGALALHYGTIAEMQTGEGKTLTASMPLYLNAMTSKPVHLVTVNDYLAKRDSDWIGTIFKKLGLSVSALTNDVPVQSRKEVYAADVIYGTASEFGFDYLRDNSMATKKEEQCQGHLFFAIIDEIDSILIDEARTPLIISGPSPVSRQMYDSLKSGVAYLVKLQRDYCNRLASEARRVLDSLGQLEEQPKKLSSKDEEQQVKEAFQKLWLVSKGTPCHKILQHVKENPDARAQIDSWETHYYSDQNKEEKAEQLASLCIIIDERANEYELTDKGIHSWVEFYQNQESSDDFVMLDLGNEYIQIDNDSSLSEQEKMQKKILIREEDSKRKERAHNLRQLFRAHLLMEKDVDYIVQNDQIIIIDENTGRPQPGRRFSDGLHQAIEAKESVSIQGETQTYATITLQNFFRMYEKIAGMTGTAATEAGEFKSIYKLDVLEIPTYCPCNRKDSDDEIYMTEREKYSAILKEINTLNTQGRPILIGTESVEVSEKLSRILRQNKLEHTVLNAKNHSKEAEIIANAGQKAAITIATNMAGRGTDIKISKEVAQFGGLHVLGTTRHHSRRIDRQLRGRSGRLGDPGSSKFFVSFEDSLLRLFASPRLTTMLQKFRPPEGEAISAKILNRSIETAQKRIEQRNYMIRKHTLEYDDVMNRQRQEIYAFRNELLSTSTPALLAEEVIAQVCLLKAQDFFVDKANNQWDSEGFRQWLMEQFPVTFEKTCFEDDYATVEQLEEIASTKILEAFRKKLQLQKEFLIKLHPDEERAIFIINDVIRNLMIRTIDELWQEHLLTIDHLRSDVSLRAFGQKDPLLEFKQEAFQLFETFSKTLRFDISRDLFNFELMPVDQKKRFEEMLSHMQLHTQKSFVPQPEEPSEQLSPQKEIENSSPSHQDNNPTEKPSPFVATEEKVGRNDLCHCGSGKKYKKCCAKFAKPNES
jgi:preprotein translocase subunit SecA